MRSAERAPRGGTGRTHRRIALALVAMCLAWLVLVRGYADFLARPDPARALALSAAQPEALVRLGEEALRDGDIDGAERLASQLLRAQPLDGRALRLLGAVAERRGDRPRALALMREAAARTPRDAAAQFWLAINALADRDLPQALLKLDRLVRFEPELQADVFPILATIASNPVGAREIAPYLAADAPWRREFLNVLIPQAAQVEVLIRLLRAVEGAGGRVRPEEHSEVLQRLWVQRDWRRVRGWLARTNPGPPAGLVHDGGFDGSGNGPWQGWSILKAVGVDSLAGADLGAGLRGLRVIFHDRRVPYSQVSQNLLLEPGHYRLSVRTRLQRLELAQGLRWVIRCVDDDRAIGSTALLRGDLDWHLVETDFEVPPAGCGGQELRLQLDWRIAAEQQARGEAWFDELTIVSIEAAAARAAQPASAPTAAP